jgi:ABC-2 type transport system permease protein
MIRRTFGSIKGIAIFLLAPALLIALVISILGYSSGELPAVAYVDADRGGLAAHIGRELEHSGSFALVRADSAEVARASVSDRKTDAAVLIPESFSERILRGESPDIELVQMKVDEGTFSLKLQLEQAVRGIVQSVGYSKQAGMSGTELRKAVEQVLAQREKGQIGIQKTDYKLSVNPAVGTATGILLMFILTLVNSSVSSIVDDRTNRTISRIYTAPVRAIEIAIGNFAGGIALGTLQTVIVLLFSRYVLGFDYGVGFWLHLLVIEFFLLAAMGIGCAVAGLVKNPNHLGSINSLVVTPTCMLGGCFWPVEMTPDFMQKLANIVPQRWAIDALQKLAAGESIAGVSLNLAILTLFAIVLLGFGSAVLKPGER